MSKMTEMKKIVMLWLLAFSVVAGRAEDVIQVVPFEAKPGMTTDDMACFSVKMNNSHIYWAFQLDILLPEGMALDNTDGLNPFELNLDRFPHSSRGGIVTFKHGVAWNHLSNGWYRVVVSPNDATRINGYEGEIMKVYYLTDSDMKPGLYPIYVKGTVLTITGTSDVQPGPSSSYVTVGDSPLKTDENPDLSSLTGYLPSWVVEEMNAQMAGNNRLTGISLTGADSLGLAPSCANPNAFCYVKKECKLLEPTSGTVGTNIVRMDGESGTCAEVILDEEYPFALSCPVDAGSVTLRRALFTADWNTVCLPFALSGQAVREVFGDEAGLYGFDGLQDGKLCFSPVEGGEAHTPYLLYTTQREASGEVLFSDVSLLPVSAQPETSDGGVRFVGNYSGRMSASGFYGVTPDARIALGGGQAVLPGFRAYFDLAGSVATVASRLWINGVTTTVDHPEAVRVSGRVDVYTLSGTCVRSCVERETALDGLAKGIYIIDNEKIIVY